MAAAATRLSSSPAFDEHNSLDESMDDFGQSNRTSPMFGLPSQHSGFKSSEEESSDQGEDVVSEEPWSPPAWRSTNPAGGWYRHQPYPQDEQKSRPSASASRSREASHESYASAVEEEDDDDTKMPGQIPLLKKSQSPAKEQLPIKTEDRSTSPYLDGDREFSSKSAGEDTTSTAPENTNNCTWLLFHSISFLLLTSTRFPFRTARRSSATYRTYRSRHALVAIIPSPHL